MTPVEPGSQAGGGRDALQDLRPSMEVRAFRSRRSDRVRRRFPLKLLARHIIPPSLIFEQVRKPLIPPLDIELQVQMHTKKAELVPASSFSEPSEPSQVRPEDKPADTLRGPQEENPQLVAHSKGRQSADGKGARTAGRGNSGDHRDEARRANEEKMKDVAGGFGVGRSKL